MWSTKVTVWEYTARTHIAVQEHIIKPIWSHYKEREFLAATAEWQITEVCQKQVALNKWGPSQHIVTLFRSSVHHEILHYRTNVFTPHQASIYLFCNQTFYRFAQFNMLTRVIPRLCELTAYWPRQCVASTGAQKIYNSANILVSND